MLHVALVQTLGLTYTDDDLLRYVVNIYGVLLTRGMLGTYVYVCDPGLREYLRVYVRGPVAVAGFEAGPLAE